MAAMRLALADAAHQVFLVAAGGDDGGVVVALFLPEKPRRRRNGPILQVAAADITATGLAAPSPIPAEAEPDLVGAPAPRARAWAASRRPPRTCGPPRNRHPERVEG